MYSLPQEIEVWYIIPAIRRELSLHLTSKYKLSYEKAGNALGISKAAVSQYLTKKRANKIIFNDKVKKRIKTSAKIISENPRAALNEIQEILNFMRETKSACDVCKKYNKGILEYCNNDPRYVSHERKNLS
jgi:uncharacterized protein